MRSVNGRARRAAGEIPAGTADRRGDAIVSNPQALTGEVTIRGSVERPGASRSPPPGLRPDRPGNPSQSSEKIESTPGNERTREAQDPLAPLERGEGWGEGPGRSAAVGPRPAPHPNLLPVNGEKDAPPPRQATIARKIRRMTLKRLNLRPETATIYLT